MISGNSVDSGMIRPHVEIVEHPASKALRFRYECEGRSAGSIPGANSTPENKTFPTIRINGYHGHGVVVVSCVTKDYPHRPHPHSLVGKDTCNQGVCRMEFKPDNPVVSFVNLGIQCVKKKDIYEALQLREEIRVDPFRTGFDHKRQLTSIDLNAVRLCFQVFTEGREGKINVPLQPVVSEPIYDKKAMSDLLICKMSHHSATVDGGTEMVLLCEKVAKDNIQVRFFEKRDGCEVWEGLGDFKSIHVHKQVAIAFRTPSYRHRQIVEPVQVYVQLRRPTDGVTSEPWPFQLLPSDALDHDSLRRKRRKFEDNPRAHVLRHLQAEAEKEGVLLDDTLARGSNPMKLEARVQSFSYYPTLPGSPGMGPLYTLGAASSQSPTTNRPNTLVEVPAYGNQVSGSVGATTSMAYGSYNIPRVRDHEIVNGQYHASRKHNTSNKLQDRQETSKIHQQASGQYDYYQQQRTTDQQSNMGLLKMTPTQSAFDGNVDPEVLEGAAAAATGGTGLMEVSGHQQCSFDANLSQLDSAELAFFDVALSETLSNGLLINDACVKIETTNGALSAMPVSVGSSAS